MTWHPRYKYSIAGLKVNGERRRAMFETETAAKDELRKLRIIHESNRQAGLSLADNLRLAAVECTKLLRPYG